MVEVSCLCIVAFSLVFTPYLLNAVVSGIHALVALKPLVSRIDRLVAFSARISINRQTDKRTDRRTDGLTKYCNPRCACAPSVKILYLGGGVIGHSIVLGWMFHYCSIPHI